MEGKITIRFDSEKNEEYWRLTVGCNLPGKWILHWGVYYTGDLGRHAFSLLMLNHKFETFKIGDELVSEGFDLSTF